MTCGRPRPDMKRAANREDEKSTQATSAPHVNSLVQAPYQVKDGSSLRTCIRHEEQLLAQASDPEAYNREIIWPDKVRINRAYVEHYTFLADLRCLAATVSTVLQHEPTPEQEPKS